MMKRVIFLGMTLLLFTCIALVGCAAPIRGSGDVVEEKREVSGFDRVQLDGVGELILAQGENESLLIEAEDNLMQYIKSSVRGDQLIIDIQSRRPLVPTEPIKFYVTMKEIEGVAVDGAGSVHSEGIETKSLELDINGAGDIMIDDLDADSVEVSINGIGNLELDGKTESQTIQIDGAGNYNGKELKSQKASIQIDGVGSAKVDVDDELEVEINGSGQVIYTGNPNVDKSVNGLGRVSQR